MKVQLTDAYREVLRQFKIGTPVMSKSGEYIGHVVGYASRERGFLLWESEGRFIYQLKVLWMDDTEYATASIEDIQLL